MSSTGSAAAPEEAAAEDAAALEAELPGITAVQCDVASRASCELAFRAAEQALGRVDVLVSNAGIAQQKLFTDITPEEWQHMLDVNLTGAFHLCQLALPGMIRRKAGRILTVSSMWGQTGGSCEVHYSAAKAGLIGLTKALAKEEGPSGITVNCVAPGVIETDMMAAFTAEDKAALAEETATVIAYNYVPLTDSAPVRAAVKKMQAGEDAELRYYNFYDRNDCQGIDGMRLTVKDGVAAFQEISLTGYGDTVDWENVLYQHCLLYTSPSPRDS